MSLTLKAISDKCPSLSMYDVYHVSPVKNLDKIRRHGLDPCCSTNGTLRVWFCMRGQIPWALNHLAEHHKTDEFDLFGVKDCEFNLIRHRTGIYYTMDHVPAAYLVRLLRIKVSE